MRITTLFELGRVSNLPTVWCNVFAGASLAGASLADARMAALLLAMSLAYVGGMYLNDALDREIDAAERPERPIPSGRIQAGTVFLLGYGMLFAAVLMIVASKPHLPAVLSAIALAAVIILYNIWHKGNIFSPVLMGLCRALVYIATGYALLPEPSPALYVGAAVLFCYLIGLTYTAKQEKIGRITNAWPLLFLAAPLVYGVAIAWTSPLVLLPTVLLAACLAIALRRLSRRAPGDIPRAVMLMIAGIALVDAIFLAAGNTLWPTLVAAAGCLLTLQLQRWISGT